MSYYDFHKFVEEKINIWGENEKLRKDYRNNYKKYIKSIGLEINNKIKKLEDKKVMWSPNIEVITKNVNGNATKFIKFRAVNQIGELVDVLQYIGKDKYFIHFPKNNECQNYFTSVDDINDCHDIFVIDYKLKTSNKSKVIYIPYLSRYVK